MFLVIQIQSHSAASVSPVLLLLHCYLTEVHVKQEAAQLLDSTHFMTFKFLFFERNVLQTHLNL